jgi:succinate dehydrogenase / fumarate reductase flavoprotein subunit
VYLDLRDAIAEQGLEVIEQRYGNLLEMYERISGDDPTSAPMRIYPAPHYTMGGLWVDYQLMSSIPGLFVLGEANFSEHGANRLGASALMQGLADGYFIAPATVTAWLAGHTTPQIGADHPACRQALDQARGRIAALLAVDGSRPVDAFHRSGAGGVDDRTRRHQPHGRGVGQRPDGGGRLGASLSWGGAGTGSG